MLLPNETCPSPSRVRRTDPGKNGIAPSAHLYGVAGSPVAPTKRSGAVSTVWNDAGGVELHPVAAQTAASSAKRVHTLGSTGATLSCPPMRRRLPLPIGAS